MVRSYQNKNNPCEFYLQVSFPFLRRIFLQMYGDFFPIPILCRLFSSVLTFPTWGWLVQASLVRGSVPEGCSLSPHFQLQLIASPAVTWLTGYKSEVLSTHNLLEGLSELRKNSLRTRPKIQLRTAWLKRCIEHVWEKGQRASMPSGYATSHTCKCSPGWKLSEHTCYFKDFYWGFITKACLIKIIGH